MDELPSNLGRWLHTPPPIAPQWDGRAYPEILEVSLYQVYEGGEWDTIFDSLLTLLRDERAEVRQAASRQLLQVIEYEADASLDSRERRHSLLGQPRARERAQTILATITQPNSFPGTFEMCCATFHHALEKRAADRVTFLALLREPTIKNAESVSEDARLAAEIVFGSLGTTWSKVKEALFLALDHADDNVRACAAYQIGQFVSSKTEPHVEDIAPLIADKEVGRPGVAGAFWSAHPLKDKNDWNWLLEVLCRSSSPEPYLNYFPCNLAFEAHEYFSRDPVAVQRLMTAERFDVAIMTATEENERVPGMQPLLHELGECGDEETARLAAWHLAYHYHVLHERGAKRGYVEQLAISENVILFLLWSKTKTHTSYAAVLCAAQSGGCLRYAEAEQWVDCLFPPEVRGPIQPRYYPVPGLYRYQRGYVTFVPLLGTEANISYVDSVMIGYRSDMPWNPKEYLSPVL